MAWTGRITKEEKARRDRLAEQGIKVCSECKEEKPFGEFNKSKRRADGFDNRCRSCKKQYEQENKQRIKEYKKQYEQENKERIKEYRKKRYQESKERIKEQAKQYRQENKELIKQYRQKPEVKARANKQRKQRLQSDPMFRMLKKLSCSLQKGFKRKGWKKDSSTQEIVGCSREQLILWLGGEPSKDVHIDHVIPQSLADTPEELKLLNHYTNLQLLPAEENISKGNRYIHKENLNRVLAHHPHPDKLKEIVKRSNVEII